MLYEVFNSLKEAHGQDYFILHVSDEIVQNLNPKFELREYQKETLGRFDFYFNGYQKRQFPAQLLFHMATGSGKTLIMAANILYLYKLGYRNFIFFVNSTNIIEKTRDNFLNPLSEKYLFAPKIKFSEKQVDIKEVHNFEGANPENINIIFATTLLLHTRLNYPHENALTYEDFEDKEIVLISDEAHHLQTLTKSKLTKNEQEEKKSWEYTVKRILRSNPKNVLLEFTATIDLGNSEIVKKFGENIVRSALDRFEFYKFKTLRKYFPHIKSVREFISSPAYLGAVEIEVSSLKDKLNKLTPAEKLEITLSVLKNISEQAKIKTSEFVGTRLFKANMLREVFKDKKIKIDIDEVKNKELEDVNLAEKDWYAQNEFYGTDEERNFIRFIDGFIEKLRQKYSDIALLRNEKFFQIFDFDEGRAFEPDFIMILKKRNRTISIYQIFIEPKGGWTYDMNQRFELSKEGWKQKFLLELENKADTDLKLESKHFKLIGLPFYNEKLRQIFEEVFKNKIQKLN